MRKFSGHEHLDTDLNIVPIIDCFVMLICFLLFTAAFTQLVYLEAKLTSNTAAAANKSRSELDQFRLIVSVEENRLRLQTTGNAAKKKYDEYIEASGGKYDLKSLHQKVIALKTENPERFSIDLEVKTKNAQVVTYDKLLSIMDAVRHLEDEEYAQVRIAEKKIRKIELTSSESEKKVGDTFALLGQELLANQIAANTDHKLLFPDIAIIGLD